VPDAQAKFEHRKSHRLPYLTIPAESERAINNWKLSAAAETVKQLHGEIIFSQ
jgi:hypothetical protein